MLVTYLRGEPRRGFYVTGDSIWDFGISGLDRGSIGLGFRPFEDVAVFAGLRYVRDAAFGPTLDVAWRWSEKYGLRFRETIDFRRGQDTSRLVFRRYSPDHVIEFGGQLRDGDFEFAGAVEFALGGTTTRDPYAFRDEPNLDPWGSFAGIAPAPSPTTSTTRAP
jgi:hypothetical protein